LDKEIDWKLIGQSWPNGELKEILLIVAVWFGIMAVWKRIGGVDWRSNASL